MASKRHRIRKNRTKKKYGGKNLKSGKKWVTAISAAKKTLKKTGSVNDAKKTLNKQALSNARKLFGSVGL